METQQPRIRIDGDRVVKSGPPDMLRAEVEKTRRAFEIAENCGLFRVPRVLEFDEDRGEAAFERIDGLRSIREVLADTGRGGGLLEALGAALAVVHRELHLPDELRIPLPPAYRHEGNSAFLHGDVSLDNICVQKGAPALVILDWQTTPLLGGRATWGTRYFDLAWLLHNLFCRPTCRVLLGDPITPLAKKFVAAYAAAAGEKFQTAEFISYLKKFFTLELPRVHTYTSRRYRLLLPRSLYLLRKYLKSNQPG